MEKVTTKKQETFSLKLCVTHEPTDVCLTQEYTALNQPQTPQQILINPDVIK